MNSTQEAKLNMYHAVISHCDANTVIVATVPAFATVLTALKAKVSSIDSTVQLEAQVISGVATDKKTLRFTLAQQATDIAAVVFSYAASIGNNTLKEEVDYSNTELKRLKDDDLAPVCRNIHDAANDNLLALAPYGITAGMLSSFDTMIDDYATAVPKPRNAASLRKTYAAALKTLFKESDSILKEQLDKTAVQFKATDLGFYNTYKNNRIIIDAPNSPTQVQGEVTDINNGNELSNVLVEVVGFAYTTNTDSDGEYSVKIPVPDTYSLKFSKTGYQTKTIDNVVLKLGQTTSLDVELLGNPA